MFLPIKGIYKDRLYKLYELSNSNNTKKKDFYYLYYKACLKTFKLSNFKSIFKRASLVPFNL